MSAGYFYVGRSFEGPRTVRLLCGEVATPHDIPRGRPSTAVATATLALDVVAGRVVSALEASGVACILLKGGSIARNLYASEGERGYVDVDLLIEPRALDRASDVIRELGFLPVGIPPLDGHKHHAETWQRPSNGAVVDLHRTIAWVAVPDEVVWRVLTGSTEHMDIGGASVRVLAPKALAVHLALHAVSHGADVAQPIRDLERALDYWPMDVWRGARAVADDLDALPAFRAGLTMTSGGTKVVDELALSREFAPEVQFAVFGPPGALRLTRIWAQPWRDRVRLLARQAVPPRAFMYHWAPDGRAGGPKLAWAYVRRLGAIVSRTPRALIALARTRRLG